MVTSAEEEKVVAQAMQLGASGYILKPFNTASVIETLNEARERFIVRVQLQFLVPPPILD